MTSLGVGNDYQRPMKNLKFLRNYIAKNGRQGTSDADIWADGLTVGSVTDSEFSDNDFLDNSDVDFILGGAPRTKILRNTIRHVSGYAFAAFMLTNFELYRPAPRLADFRGMTVRGLTIKCGNLCDIGVQVGVFPWGYDSKWQKYLTQGGDFSDVNISTSKQGINVAGGGIAGAPVTFARFSVTGSPAIQTSPQYLLAAFQGRRASHFNVTGPGLYSTVSFPQGGSEVTNDDWRLGYIANQDHVATLPQADAQMPPPDNTLPAFYAPLPQVRYLSNKYFGRLSTNSDAVILQLQFLNQGGTLQQLESYFAIIKRVWTNVKGTPNPAYGWVDAGMTFLINGGTEAQYAAAVGAVVFK